MGDAALWWLAVEIIGLAAFPLTFTALRFLPDRGYSVTKVVGLLLMTYPLWLGGTLHVIPNQRLSILVILIVMAAGSALIAWRNRSQLSTFFQGRWAHLIFADVLFTAVFILCLYQRSLTQDSLTGGNDNRWHIAFLNSIIRSDYFPAEDPWLSGESINYYYYGFIMIGALTKLTGIPSAVTFNLTIALIPGLAVSGMFGVVYNFLIDRGSQGWVLACGALAGVFLIFLSNIVGLFELMSIHGVGSQGFIDALDVYGLGVTRESAEWFPTDGAWMFRSINLSGNRFDSVFPFFDLLLPIGYLSARNTAIPIFLAFFAAMLNLWRGDSSSLRGITWPDALAVGFVSLILGALIAAHSWDFPTASVIVLLTLLVRSYWLEGRLNLAVFIRTAVLSALIIGLAGLLYLPSFFYASGEFGGLLVLPGRVASEPHHMLYLWLPLFWLTACLAVFALRGARVSVPALLLAAGLPVLVVTIWAAYLLIDGSFSQLENDIDVRGNAWLTVAILVSMLALAAFALLAQLATVPVEQREPPLVFALALATIALLLILGVEFFYVDEPTGRGGHEALDFATVLRVNFQGWMLLSLAGAFGMYYVATRWRPSGRLSEIAKTVWAGVTVAVLAAGLIFPVMVTAWARDVTDDLGRKRSLDGFTYLRSIQADEVEAIEYLRDDTDGAPVVMELVTDSYQNGGRISAFSGLPTVLGWITQEYYFRGTYEPWTHRRQDVALAYQTPLPSVAEDVLELYEIEYVYVGRYEKQHYGYAGLGKFSTFMDTVFAKGEVTIYKTREDSAVLGSPP